jgi:hypothetical protein
LANKYEDLSLQKGMIQLDLEEKHHKKESREVIDNSMLDAK